MARPSIESESRLPPPPLIPRPQPGPAPQLAPTVSNDPFAMFSGIQGLANQLGTTWQDLVNSGAVVPPQVGLYPQGFNPRAAPADAYVPLDVGKVARSLTTENPMFNFKPPEGTTPPLGQDVADFFGNIPVLGGLGNLAAHQLQQGPLSTYILGSNPDFNEIQAMPEGPEKRQAKAEFQQRQFENAAMGAVGGLENVGAKALRGAAAGAAAIAPSDVSRATGASTPGFMQTAEQRIALGKGPLAERPTGPITSVGVARELGQRLDKLDIPETAKALIARNALEEKAASGTGIAFESQRRRVVPDSVVDRKAQLIAEQLDVQELSRTKAGTAFNAEENRAIRKSIAQRATDLDMLNTTIQDIGLQNAPVDLKLLALKTALELNSLQRIGAGARAEAGRSLRSFQLIEDALRTKTPAAYEQAFKAIGGRADAEAKLTRLQDMWNDTSRPLELRERDVFNFVRNLDRATTAKKLEEFWLNSILSNPITHQINMIGNALLLTAERVPTRIAAATIEELVTLHGIRRPKAVTFTDTAVGAFAAFAATRKAAAKALQYAKTGVSEQDVNKFREAGSVGPRQAIEGKIGTFINLPTRALGVEDAFAYTLAQEGEAASLAARKALSEGLAPFSPPFLRRVTELTATDAIQDAATKSADYITLKTAPDKITQWLLDGRNKIPAARFVVPFIQTPANLAKRGFDYSPLGFAKLFKSGLSAEERALVGGRAAVGSGILAYFALRTMQGDVTGPAPSDAKARALFYDEGKRPFAIRVGDSWVEFGRFEPLATPIRWALAAKQAFDDTGEGLSLDVVGPMAAALGRALIDTTYLSGMSNFINALEDPSGFGERFLSRIASGAVPFSGFLRGLAGVDDPYLRDPNDLLERIESGLPGYAKNVNPLLNILGEPVSRPPSRQGIGALVNPLVAEDRPPHPVIAEDARLSDLFSREYTGMSRPSDSVSGVKLDADQQFQHEQLVGSFRKAALSQLLQSSKYQSATNADKLQLWRQTAADAAAGGRKALGLSLAANATNSIDAVSGAHIALSNSASNYERSKALKVMQLSRTLTPDVMAALDAVRGQPDPTKANYDLSVEDYLRMGQVRESWERAPEFIFGTKDEWTRAARGADLLRKLVADLKRHGVSSPTQDSQVIELYYKFPGLATFYERDGTRRMRYVSPIRQLIESDRLWSRFRPTQLDQP